MYGFVSKNKISSSLKVKDEMIFVDPSNMPSQVLSEAMIEGVTVGNHTVFHEIFFGRI